MDDDTILFPAGAEWRQWDLHIHTPASFHWKGPRFGLSPERDRDTVDQMIEALNAAAPAVFALMDYWSFDGWFRLKERLAQKGAPKLNKTIFPGIELRLMAPTRIRLNAHVVFSDKISDQYLRDFLSCLKLELIDRPLSREGLIQFARYAGADKLSKHGFKKSNVDSDDDVALVAGSHIARD